MTRIGPDEAEWRMLEFACNQCGAPSGEWCKVYRDWLPPHRAASRLHSARFWAATAAGRLPIPAEDTA